MSFSHCPYIEAKTQQQLQYLYRLSILYSTETPALQTTEHDGNAFSVITSSYFHYEFQSYFVQRVYTKICRVNFAVRSVRMGPEPFVQTNRTQSLPKFVCV